MDSMTNADQSRLEQLLGGNEATSGMYVRIRGKSLILGRREAFGPKGELEDDDRIRLTPLKGSTYELSVKRHTGRWEKTPFSGTIPELVEAIVTCLPHIVARLM